MRKQFFKKMTGVLLLSASLVLASGLTACGGDYYDDYDDGDFREDGDWGDDDWNDDEWEDDENWDDDDWDDDGPGDGERGDDGWDDNAPGDGGRDDSGNDDWGDDGQDGSSDRGGSSGNDTDWSANTSSDYSSYDQYTFGGTLGSAKELEGTTVIVSVFLNDSKTSWDFGSSDDATTRSNALTYLGIATDWITEQVATYNTTTKFIYDWSANSDLYYEGSVSCDMTDENSSDPYYDQMEWIDENIDSQAVMDAHGADDIIYMLFINTPLSNECVSATYNYSTDADYPYEVVSIYCYSENEEEAPAAYAHEILHTYGAPDLYTADTDGGNYGITQAFVNNQEENYSNDIMYTTYDRYTSETYYDYISNEFTELDAYYVGVTDYSTVASEWNLDASQH